MPRATIFNNSAILANDADAIKCLDKQNQRFSEYVLADIRPTSNYLNTMGEAGLYFGQSNTVRANRVDADSNLRHGEKGNIITHNKSRSDMSLDTRAFTTMPFSGPGSGTSRPDLEDNIRRGKLTSSKRSEKEQNFKSTFIPMIPELKQAYSNPDHFIEKNWTRGGINTRSVKQNCDYAKAYGLRK